MAYDDTNRINQSNAAANNTAVQNENSNSVIFGGIITSADSINSLQDDVWSTDYTYDDLDAKYAKNKTYKNIEAEKFGIQFRQIQAFYNVQAILAQLMKLKSETRDIISILMNGVKSENDGMDVVETTTKEAQLKQKYTLIYFNKQYEYVLAHNETVLKADDKAAQKKGRKDGKKASGAGALTDLFGLTDTKSAGINMYTKKYQMNVQKQYYKQMSRIMEQFEKLMQNIAAVYGGATGDSIFDAINRKKAEILSQLTWDNLTVKAGKGGYKDINKNEALALRIALIAFQNYLNIYMMIRLARQAMRNAVTQMMTGSSVGEGFTEAAIALNQTMSAFENQMFSMSMEQLFQTVSAYDNYIMAQNAYKKAKIRFAFSGIPFIGAWLGAKIAHDSVADAFKPSRLDMEEVWELIYSRYGIRRNNNAEEVFNALDQKSWQIVAQLDNRKAFKLDAGDKFQSLNETKVARIQEELGNIFNIRNIILLVARSKGKLRSIVFQEMTSVTAEYKTDPEGLRHIVRAENDTLRLAVEMKVDTIRKEIAENNRQRQEELELEQLQKRMIYGLICMVVMIVLTVLMGGGLIAIFGAAMSGWGLGQSLADAQFNKERMKNIKTDFHSTELLYLGGQDQFENRVRDVFRRAQNWDKMAKDAGNEYQVLDVAKAAELRAELTAIYITMLVLHVVGKSRQSFRDIVTQTMGHSAVGDLRGEVKDILEEKYKTWSAIYNLAMELVQEEIKAHNQLNKAEHDYKLAKKMLMLSLISAVVSIVAPMLGSAGGIISAITSIVVAVMRYQFLKQAAEEEKDFGSLKSYSDEQAVVDLITRKTGNAAWDALSQAEKKALLMMTIDLVESIGHGYYGFDSSQMLILRERIEGVYRVKEALVESAHAKVELRRAVLKVLGKAYAPGNIAEVLSAVSAEKETALNALEQFQKKIESYIMRLNEINEREKAAFIAKISMIFAIISAVLSLVAQAVGGDAGKAISFINKILFNDAVANYLALKMYDKKVSKKKKKSPGVGESVFDGKSQADYGQDKLAWGFQKYDRLAKAEKLEGFKIEFQMQKLQRDWAYEDELYKALQAVIKNIIMVILEEMENSGGGGEEGGGEGGGEGAGAGQAANVAQKGQQLQQAQEQLQQAQKAAQADPNNIEKQNAVGDAKKNVDEAQKAFQEALKQMEQDESSRGGQKRRGPTIHPNQMPVSDIASYSQLVGQMQEMYFKEMQQTLKTHEDTAKPAKSYLDQKAAERLKQIVKSIDPETGKLLGQLNDAIAYYNSTGDASQIQRALDGASPQAVQNLANAVAQADLATSQSPGAKKAQWERQFKQGYREWYGQVDRWENGQDGGPKALQAELVKDFQAEDAGEKRIDKNVKRQMEDILERTAGQEITEQNIRNKFRDQIAKMASNPRETLIAADTLKQMETAATRDYSVSKDGQDPRKVHDQRLKTIQTVRESILESQNPQNLLNAIDQRQEEIMRNTPLRGSREEVMRKLESTERVRASILDKNPAIAQRMIEERKQEFLSSLPTNAGISSETPEGQVGQTRAVAGTETGRQSQSGQHYFEELAHNPTINEDISRPGFVDEMAAKIQNLDNADLSENSHAAQLLPVMYSQGSLDDGKKAKMENALVAKAGEYINQKLNSADFSQKDLKDIVEYLGGVPEATYQKLLSEIKLSGEQKFLERFSQAIGQENYHQLVDQKELQARANLATRLVQENIGLQDERDSRLAGRRIAELVGSIDVAKVKVSEALERRDDVLGDVPGFEALAEELAANPRPVESLALLEQMKTQISQDGRLNPEVREKRLGFLDSLKNTVTEKVVANPDISAADKIKVLAAKETLTPDEEAKLSALAEPLIKIEQNIQTLDRLSQVIDHSQISAEKKDALKKLIGERIAVAANSYQPQELEGLSNSSEITPETKQRLTEIISQRTGAAYQILNFSNFSDFAKKIETPQGRQEIANDLAGLSEEKLKQVLSVLTKDMAQSEITSDGLSRFNDVISRVEQQRASQPEIESFKDTLVKKFSGQISQKLRENDIAGALNDFQKLPEQMIPKVVEKLNQQEVGRLVGQEVDRRVQNPEGKKRIIGEAIRELKQAKQEQLVAPPTTQEKFNAKVEGKVKKIEEQARAAQRPVARQKPPEVRRGQEQKTASVERGQRPQPERKIERTVTNADSRELESVLDQFDKKDPAAEARLTQLINAYTANPGKLSRALQDSKVAGRVDTLLQNNPKIKGQLDDYLKYIAPPAASQQLRNILGQNGIRLAAGPASQEITKGRPQVEVADLSGKDGFKALAESARAQAQAQEEREMDQLFKQADAKIRAESQVKEGRVPAPSEPTKLKGDQFSVGSDYKFTAEPPQQLGQLVEEKGEAEQSNTDSGSQSETGAQQNLTPEKILEGTFSQVDDQNISDEDLKKQILATQNAFIELAKTGAYNSDKLSQLGAQITQLEQEISQSGRTDPEIFAALDELSSQIQVTEESPPFNESDTVKFLKALRELVKSTGSAKKASAELSPESEEFAKMVLTVTRDVNNFCTAASKLARDDATRGQLAQIRFEAQEARGLLEGSEPKAAEALEHLENIMASIGQTTSRIASDLNENTQNIALRYVQKASENISGTIANLGAGQLLARVRNANYEGISQAPPEYLKVLMSRLEKQSSPEEIQVSLVAIRDELKNNKFLTPDQQKVLDSIETQLNGEIQEDEGEVPKWLTDFDSQEPDSNNLKDMKLPDLQQLFLRDETSPNSETRGLERNITNLGKETSGLALALAEEIETLGKITFEDLSQPQTNQKAIKDFQRTIQDIAREVDRFTNGQFNFEDRALRIDYQNILKSEQVHQELTAFFDDLTGCVSDSQKLNLEELDKTIVGRQTQRQFFVGELKSIKNELDILSRKERQNLAARVKAGISKARSPEEIRGATNLYGNLPKDELQENLKKIFWHFVSSLNGQLNLSSGEQQAMIQKLSIVYEEFGRQAQGLEDKGLENESLKMKDALVNKIWDALKKVKTQEQRVEILKTLKLPAQLEETLAKRLEFAAASQPAQKIQREKRPPVKPAQKTDKKDTFAAKFVETLRDLFRRPTAKAGEASPAESKQPQKVTPKNLVEIVRNLSQSDKTTGVENNGQAVKEMVDGLKKEEKGWQSIEPKEVIETRNHNISAKV